MGNGRPEKSDDSVAQDLVDDPAEHRYVACEALKSPVDQVFDLLGVAVLGQAGEPDNVSEKYGDNAPFFACGRLRRPTIGAESSPNGDG